MMAETLVPTRLTGKLSRLDFSGLGHLYNGEYSDAERIFQEQLDMLSEAQSKDDTRYHKGGPLHNLGLTLLYENRIPEGSRFLFAAFVEDIVSFGLRESLEYPANRLLTELGFEPSSQYELAKSVDTYRQEVIVLRDSLKVVHLVGNRLQVFNHHRDVPASLPPWIRPEAASSPPTSVMNKVQKCLARVGGAPDCRVFVGGAHRNIALLRYIAKTVKDKKSITGKCELTPILVNDLSVKFSDNESYYASMELLHRCKSAIFEVSISNGHMMEIERCHRIQKSTGIEVLMAWQIRRRSKNVDRSIPSRMLITESFEKYPYKTLEELEKAINAFLDSRVLKTGATGAGRQPSVGVSLQSETTATAFSTSSANCPSKDYISGSSMIVHPPSDDDKSS